MVQGGKKVSSTFEVLYRAWSTTLADEITASFSLGRVGGAVSDFALHDKVRSSTGAAPPRAGLYVRYFFLILFPVETEG